MNLPKGNVTFLFTDIEGSTRLWEAHREAMSLALKRHDEILRGAAESRHGYVFKTVGDAFCVAFSGATDAVAATIAIQNEIANESWPAPVVIRVRCAIHTGPAEERDSDYFGPTLNRIARLLSLAKGGESLITAATYELVRDFLPKGVDVVEHGLFELKDLDRPERVYRLGQPEPAPKMANDQKPSIAVLPMVNMSADPENEYFADGLTEEILNVLAKNPNLRVTSRTSAFTFKGTSADIPTVARKLGVQYVLEGSVRKGGSRVRITMQLVDVARDAHIWSETYDRELEDIFAVQDEISRAVAERLRVSLDAYAEATGTANMEAYDQLLKGRALQWQRGRMVAGALEHFRLAVILDPNYAEALGFMSDSYRLLGLYSIWPAAVTMPYAKAAAERALELDPNLAEGHSTMADIKLVHDRDMAGAVWHWNRAIEISPSHSRARCEYALWGLWAGACSPEEAMKQVDKAKELDPLNPWVRAMRSMALAIIGRLDEAILESAQSLELGPTSMVSWWMRLEVLLIAGRFEQVLKESEQALRVTLSHPWIIQSAASAMASVGDKEGAERLYAEIMHRAKVEYIQPMIIAGLAAACGRVEEALSNARAAFAEGDFIFFGTNTLGGWTHLRKLPEYRELRQSAMDSLKK